MKSTWQSANYFKKFSDRHIGPDQKEINKMLSALGFDNLEQLINIAIPEQIKNTSPMDIPEAVSEDAALNELRKIMGQNQVFRSLIGMGYSDCNTPAPIKRNILENPAWYTQYTPYQAEIAQGRLEALLNFQTMVGNLSGLPIANASLLDEGTAAAEAMNLSFNQAKKDASNLFFVAENCHPQTIEVVKTRAAGLGIKVVVGKPDKFSFEEKPVGVLLQYPATDGQVNPYSETIAKAKKQGVLVTMATDLLALCSLKSPGELGADIAVGNSQRFGVPLGYGGPHAGFFATKQDLMRKIPGRIVGISKDSHGNPALRLALQTREQHIRRDKATSNICTAQVLLAIMSSMYAVYHGPKGLRQVSESVNAAAKLFAAGLKANGLNPKHEHFFDTVAVEVSPTLQTKIKARAESKKINLRYMGETSIAVSFDEKSDAYEIESLLEVFFEDGNFEGLKNSAVVASIPENLIRTTEYLTHPTFNSYHSETELMRYIRRLEARDLSLTRSMIPLGSCTMKLNAAVELEPVSWQTVNAIHPFAPLEQAKGYQQLFQQLEVWLSQATGFDRVSLQPNSGAQGEFAGLMVIAKYHKARGDAHRNICLIPSSAHGTNPASAVLAGMKVVVVKCDSEGNVDVDDLKKKATTHKDKLSALMITYPSTHGVFEDSIVDICEIIHQNGGQVYMDGANLNAQLGLCKPGKFGPDVCHLNLHKTFCIPHGGGGPGVGPIGVKSHLSDFLPSHPVIDMGIKDGVGPISSAPWGSPSILPISWMYIRMMGEEGLRQASKVAILNANYIAKRIQDHFPVVYRGKEGLVAHECIIDLKPVKKTANTSVDDIAKRLIDYGYHAPTVSWPVPNSMMIEPTESESLNEIDRFCDAMISIRSEISRIESGEWSKDDNPLINAPHTSETLISDSWEHSYSRKEACFPAEYIKESKIWPHVGRVDNAFGDRILVCSCPTIED